MDERNEIIILYDFYGDLLSNSQKKYFEDYYFNNYSLGEISDESSVSRNAIHKQLKNAEEKLKFYEEKLKLKEKTFMLDKIIDKINDKKLKNDIKKIIES